MGIDHYKPEYEFGADEFVAAFDAYARGAESPSMGYTPTAYFAAEYPDPKESSYKHRRFAASVLYLYKHLRAFDEFVVRGEKRGLVSAPIVLALWRYYGQIPEESLQTAPPEEMILRFAREEAE